MVSSPLPSVPPEKLISVSGHLHVFTWWRPWRSRRRGGRRAESLQCWGLWWFRGALIHLEPDWVFPLSDVISAVPETPESVLLREMDFLGTGPEDVETCTTKGWRCIWIRGKRNRSGVKGNYWWCWITEYSECVGSNQFWLSDQFATCCWTEILCWGYKKTKAKVVFKSFLFLLETDHISTQAVFACAMRRKPESKYPSVRAR